MPGRNLRRILRILRIKNADSFGRHCPSVTCRVVISSCANIVVAYILVYLSMAALSNVGIDLHYRGWSCWALYAIIIIMVVASWVSKQCRQRAMTLVRLRDRMWKRSEGDHRSMFFTYILTIHVLHPFCHLDSPIPLPRLLICLPMYLLFFILFFVAHWAWFSNIVLNVIYCLIPWATFFISYSFFCYIISYTK